MKKTKVMRLLSLLLVMTLISTCAISGTFAKYVTKAEGQDQARVAKWGVLVSVDGGAFADKYEATDESYKAAFEEGETAYSVISSVEGEQVVAPGTSAKEADMALVATVTGTPEVAARYTLEGKDIKDVSLKAGTYTDYTHLVKAADGTYGYTDKFTLEKDYAPVKWNLTISGKGAEYDLVELLYNNLPAANLEQAKAYGLTPNGCSIFDAIAIIQKVAGNEGYKNIVEDALGKVVSGGRNFQLEADKDAGTFKLSYDFDPNKEMNFKFELSWSWAFEQENVELFDAADTYLGNVAAGVIEDDNASTTIKATFIATATQID